MSRILALIAAVSLLGLSACKSMNGGTPEPAAAQPSAEISAPPAATATEAAPPAMAEPAPAAEEAAAPPAGAAPAPATPSAAKPEAPAPKVAKPASITREEALALAAKGNCVTCHKIESRLVGPAWKDVGAKYRGDPNAAGTIASHIKSGGSFGWKFGVMPPRGGSQLSDADVAKLAAFIAGLR
jgi:cytochrome c